MRSLSALEVERARAELTAPYSLAAEDSGAINAGMRLHLALKQIAQGKKLDGFATECWSGLPKELGLNPCLGFIEDAYTLACEGDVMLSASLLMVKYLTGASAYSGDVYDLDISGVLTLTHCGAPVSLASSNRNVLLAKSQLGLERGFETITCRPSLPEGPVTLVRFYGRDCDQMHIAGGAAAGDVQGSERTSAMSVRVRLDGNRWEFLEQCLGNHYVVAPGDIRSELKLLCKWLGITLNET
jgi:L-fucose isomerase-like protein